MDNSKLISEISRMPGDKLIDFMDKYNLIGLRDAKKEQLEEYIDSMKGEEHDRIRSACIF